MKNNAILLALSIVVAGCATPTTGIVDLGNGYNTVAHQGNGAWVTTASLKTSSLAEAKQHCVSQQKDLSVINVNEIPAGAFGRWPEAEVTFACK